MEQKSIYEELSSDIISTEKFRKIYEELLKSQHIGTKKEKNLSLEDIKFILQSAAVFACSNDDCKKLAYKIATILSENYSQQYDEINKIVQYIIINSGQLPVVQKNINDGNKDYFSIYKDSGIPYNPLLFKNIITKQILNKLPIRFEGKEIYLTDFQSKTFDNLDKGKSISISAPTSAGKSFLLKAYLANRFKEKQNFCVVYIVPTRALISQVQKDFRISLKDFDSTDVQITSSANYNKDRNITKKLFILTQERFHNLLFDTDFDEPLDVLIIDEAQKVSDGSRGILLEEVIEEAIKRNIQKKMPLQKIFLSPFSKNPGKFAEMFRLTDLQSEKTRLSPVAQNLILINVLTSSYSLKLATVEFEHEISICEDKISEEEREYLESKNWPLLWTAKKFCDDYNIVYCNSPRMCVDSAILFSSKLPPINCSEVDEVIAFLKDQIHDQYYLIQCLKKGVAYHYGKLPNNIRVMVENLFRNKKIKYIFCTSTLLEGVNLPAQNIFIYKPTQGKSGMNCLNFWNLAGRAGRLLKDYHGNIFCVNISEWKGYKPNPHDVEHEIESLLEGMIINKNKEVMNYLKNLYFNLKSKDRPIEQAITRFIIHEMKGGGVHFIEELIKRNPKFEIDKLKAIQEEIQNISKEIQLPAKLIQKNSSIDPRIQQKLLANFRENTPMLPVHPTEKDSLKNLTEIFRIIKDFFMNKKDNSHRYYAPLAFSWINNKTMPELIKFKIYNITKKETLTQEMLNGEIEKLFEDLDDKIRFEYQKFLKCYIDVLLFYYDECKYDQKKICVQLPMYLEYGTFNKNILLLQSVGFSRSTAININALTSGMFSDENDCINWVKKNKDYIKNSISRLLWTEIEEVV